MKKTAAGWIWAVLLAAGCSGDPGQQQPVEQTAEQEGVWMETKETVYPPDAEEVIVVLTNNSGEEITYGKSFEMEKNENGEWVQVPFKDGAAFIAVVLSLAPGESAEDPISLSLFHQPLEKGMYRIVKDINGQPETAGFSVE